MFSPNKSIVRFVRVSKRIEERLLTFNFGFEPRLLILPKPFICCLEGPCLLIQVNKCLVLLLRQFCFRRSNQQFQVIISLFHLATVEVPYCKASIDSYLTLGVFNLPAQLHSLVQAVDRLLIHVDQFKSDSESFQRPDLKLAHLPELTEVPECLLALDSSMKVS
jgi:hypothetical protein